MGKDLNVAETVARDSMGDTAAQDAMETAVGGAQVDHAAPEDMAMIAEEMIVIDHISHNLISAG